MVNVFEILVIVVLLLSLVNPFLKKKIKEKYVLISILFFILLDLLINSYRWAMSLVYGLALILIVINLFKLKSSSEKVITKNQKIFRIILTIIAVLVLIAAIILLAMFPVVDLPKPTGEYNVGTTYMNFKDDSRLEVLTDNPDDYRELEARIWYPIDDVSSNKDVLSYRESFENFGSINYMGSFPSFIFGHYRLAKTNSYLDEPVSSKFDSYPVLFFSTGFLSRNDDYQLFMEELASNGYIVISLKQSYESRSVVKPSGEIIPFTKEHGDGYKRHIDITLPFWKRFWASNNTEEKIAISKEIIESDTFMDEVLDIRTSDIQFVVDELEKIESTEILYDKLDLENLGIFGHSMGGAVAGQTCFVDNRFKAGINLDGFQWGDVMSGITTQPFMIVYSEPFAYANDFVLDNYNNTLYQLAIKGSTHTNFDDNMIVMPITKKIGMVGSIDKNRMQEISNEYIVSFFDRYLKNEDVSFAEFDEVEFEIVHY